VRKYDLHQRYGVEVTSDLVLMDDMGWYPQLRLHYFLTLGRQYLSMRDRSAADFQLKMGSGDVFVPDFNSSQLGLKIRAFDLLGITALLAQDGRELRNSDEDIQAIAAKAKPTFRTLNCHMSSNSPSGSLLCQNPGQLSANT
jgi:hypothetical protein